ncbi:substrate-binding periplasmic protein [Halarcobacter anaerophilus]|uniref:substrate-binding periplasmic protein n=1 Tax=Halarcobacter anaerophilus TaxID=877500 RepID=UPI0005C8A59A|nr:transporter substrate-binding domain-containing protein [Halarcobacter anaerophilus]
MKKIIFLLSIFIYFQAAPLPTFKIMTENYPPLNMENKKGELTGIGVEVFDEMLKRVGSKQSKKDFELMPWSRAYNIVKQKKNTVLFTTSRTKQRENLFKWVGPFGYSINGLIARKNSHIKINSLKDLNKYQVGTVLNDVGELILFDNGISKNNIQSVSGKNAILKSIRKLDAKRIDLFSYGIDMAKWDMKANGISFDDYEVVYELKRFSQYFTFNKQTPDYIIKMFQEALESMKKDGTLEKIVSKY